MNEDTLWKQLFKKPVTRTTKVIVLDRDGLINHNSSDVNSPYYYILHKDHVALKDGVVEAFKLLKKLNIPVVLATKQLAISKKLISHEEVQAINEHIQEMLDFRFHRIYIEPKNKLKVNIFGYIIDDYRVHPSQVLLIDDDKVQTTLGKVLGFETITSDNLLESLNEFFG